MCRYVQCYCAVQCTVCAAVCRRGTSWRRWPSSASPPTCSGCSGGSSRSLITHETFHYLCTNVYSYLYLRVKRLQFHSPITTSPETSWKTTRKAKPGWAFLCLWTTVDRRVGNEYTLFNMVFTRGPIKFVALDRILIEIVLFTGRGNDKPGWSLHWPVRLQRRHPQPSAVRPKEHFTPLLHLYLWTQFW